MGPEFFQTPMGAKFYQGTMPELSRNVANLAEALKGNTEEMISPAAKRAILSAYQGNHETLNKMRAEYIPGDDENPEGSYEEGYENGLKFVLRTLGIEIPEE